MANTLSLKKDSTNSSAASYGKIIKNVVTTKGLFTVHFAKDRSKLYFELPDSVFNNLFLLSNRIAQTSNTKDFVAGQMVTRPMLVRFSQNGQQVLLHAVQHQNYVLPDDPIAPAFEKNFVDPVLKGFKIEARKNGNVVIDVTSFFGTDEKCISPIKQDNPLAKLMGQSDAIKGTFVPAASTLEQVKCFPNNIEIRTFMTFNTKDAPYTLTTHRSLVLLPKEPMQARFQDNRVGIFSIDKNLYSSDYDKVQEQIFITRWRLEPKAAERELYFKGELVEPAKPIVFYVDSAFPEKWKETVKQGIRDWNQAFEKAGFKNAIQALDYPNDSTFDPDDMRYSCIKYAASPIANAMGPSFIDPRSGEILTADVIWYHNIVSLLHDWRFAQTAATDPRVRKITFDDDVMRESMRYVASHEVGHTLGLMHNMGASFAFPVDSLRSPSFTAKYGTTPSIMDYARNNFIAQPGDFEKGVRMTPPVMGVYDQFAIEWAYRIIPGVATPQEELPYLRKWIQAKSNDRMYEFGAQQFFGTVDPTAQTEDLGNDHIAAGDYAISNLRIIMKNLESWLLEEGENFNTIENSYQSVVKQYGRHLGHVMPYIGGIKFKEIRQGEAGLGKSYCNKQEQKRAMKWLINQARTYNEWLTPDYMIQRLALNQGMNDKFLLSIVGCLYHGANLQRIAEAEKVDPVNNYRLTDYLSDVYNEIFASTIKGQKLKDEDLNMQSAAIMLYTSYSGLKPKTSSASAKKLATDIAYEEIVLQKDVPSLPCSHACTDHSLNTSEHSFLRINMGLPTLPSTISAPLMTAELKKVLSLYKQRQGAADSKTRAFYQYHILQIEKLLKSN